SPICAHSARHSVELAAMKQPASTGPAAACPVQMGIIVSASARGAADIRQIAAAQIARATFGVMTEFPDAPIIIAILHHRGRANNGRPHGATPTEDVESRS